MTNQSEEKTTNLNSTSPTSDGEAFSDVKYPYPYPSGMKIDEILSCISDLSRSQGYWGRLLEGILEVKEDGGDSWDKLVKELEYEEFHTILELVRYFEEGTHTNSYLAKKKAEGYQTYTVHSSCTYETEVAVLAKSEEEAKDIAKLYSSDMSPVESTRKVTIISTREINPNEVEEEYSDLIDN